MGGPIVLAYMYDWEIGIGMFLEIGVNRFWSFMCIFWDRDWIYGQYVFGVEYNVNVLFYVLDEGGSDVG